MEHNQGDLAKCKVCDKEIVYDLGHPNIWKHYLSEDHLAIPGPEPEEIRMFAAWERMLANWHFKCQYPYCRTLIIYQGPFGWRHASIGLCDGLPPKPLYHALTDYSIEKMGWLHGKSGGHYLDNPFNGPEGPLYDGSATVIIESKLWYNSWEIGHAELNAATPSSKSIVVDSFDYLEDPRG